MNLRDEMGLDFKDLDQLKEDLAHYYNPPITQKLIDFVEAHPEEELATAVNDCIGIISMPKTLISPSLIKKLHAMMLPKGARASKLSKSGKIIEISAKPGRFRTNRIGLIRNKGIEKKICIPPEKIPQELSKLCKYVNNESAEHPIVKATNTHFLFSIIHPFRDGNGRVGRMLINIILLKHHYPPISFEDLHVPEVHEDYKAKIKVGDEGNLAPLAKLILEKTLMKEKEMLKILNQVLPVGSRA